MALNSQLRYPQETSLEKVHRENTLVKVIQIEITQTELISKLNSRNSGYHRRESYSPDNRRHTSRRRSRSYSREKDYKRVAYDNKKYTEEKEGRDLRPSKMDDLKTSPKKSDRVDREFSSNHKPGYRESRDYANDRYDRKPNYNSSRDYDRYDDRRQSRNENGYRHHDYKRNDRYEPSRNRY